MMLLSLTQSLLVFYLLFCVARMVWAGPFELAIYGAVNNWFVARRAFATSIATVAQMAGLVAMPLIAQLAMQHSGWRFGWLVDRIPDPGGRLSAGLALHGAPAGGSGACPRSAARRRPRRSVEPQLDEPSFSRREALGTAAFWLLLLYTVLVYPVQAGVSLHQAAHLIERGVAPTIAAAIVSTFSLTSAVASLTCGLLPRSLPIRYPMALIGVFLTARHLADGRNIVGRTGVCRRCPVRLRHRRPPDIAADRLGRLFRARQFAAIRSVALSAQVLAQAAGPLLSGALHDWTGNYKLSLQCFAVLSGLSILAALIARRPT